VVELELVGIRISPQPPSTTPGDAEQVRANRGKGWTLMLLKERDGERFLPVGIGEGEAAAIARAQQGITTPRPMTHDLAARLIGVLGAELNRVVLTAVRDGTFFAEAHLSRGEEPVVVDCRPSDAVAIATLLEAPIFAPDEMLTLAAKESA
jgi:hypothetical protein